MDIERLKKLNSLAGELKHQGIAQNYEDAAFLAVTMVGEESEQCLSDMHINDDQSLVVREIIKDQPIKAEQRSVVVQGMSKAEVEGVLQNFANALAREFTSLQQTVQQQNAQLVQLTEQLIALQSLQKQQPVMVQEHVPVQRTLQPVQPTQQETAAASTGAGNPRTGTFATEDVSIEKMFYFGSKKS